MEDKRDVATLVSAVKLRVTAIHANERPTTYTIDLEDTEMVARCVMREISVCFRSVAGTKALVITIQDTSRVIDYIETVVGFVGFGKPVR